MDIKSLKDKILQLAIQGKLVPQNENDEPASILLEKIKEEKERLIKDKLIKKEKPLPEISEETLIELPNGWKWCRFSDICNFKIGKTPKRADTRYWNDGEIPWVSISDLIDGREINNTKERITYLADKEVFKGNISKKGTLIMSFKLSIGKVSILAMDAYHNEAIISIKPYIDYNEILKMYLFKVLPILDLVSDTKNAVKGSTLNSESIRNILVPLPPLEEQKRIVDKIEELFDLVDNLDNNKQDLLENINNTRNKVLQLAIQGKLVEQCEDDEPAKVLLEKIKAEKEQLIKGKVIKKENSLPEISEEEKVFDLPKGWEWCRLGNIGFTNIGLTYKPADISEEGIPVLRSTNIQNGKIDLNDLVCVKVDIPENKMCKIGDILICARNGSKRLVGKSAIINKDGMSFGAFMAIYRSKYNEYINRFINSELFRSQLGDANTVTINQITQSMLRNIVCPLPPLDEQKRIVAKVDLIMDYLDKLQQEIESQEIILEDILQ